MVYTDVSQKAAWCMVKNSWELNHSRVSGAMDQKPFIAVKHDYATAVVYNVGVQSDPRRKLPSYSLLDSQEMPLSFKHIRRNPVHHAAFWEASTYKWHGPIIPGPKLNVYRRSIPAVVLFRGRFFSTKVCD